VREKGRILENATAPKQGLALGKNCCLPALSAGGGLELEVKSGSSLRRAP